MEPTRLLDDQLDDFERALLRSARADEPDMQAIARAALALGVGTSTLTVAVGTAAASAVPAGSTVGTFSKLGVFGVVKWLSIGVAGGLMTTSGVEIARTAIGSDNREAVAAISTAEPNLGLARARPVSDLSPVPVPPAPVDSSAESEVPPSTAAFPAVSTAELNDTSTAPTPRPIARSINHLPRGDAPAAAPARAGAAPESTATPTATFALPASNSAPEAPKVPSIAEETAMLERARRALSTGNAGTALTELDTYEQSARARALGTEAAVLRVEALLQSGQSTSAVALAQRLLAAQPHGPHANRLRRVVASSPYLLRGSSLEEPGRARPER